MALSWARCPELSQVYRDRDGERAGQGTYRKYLDDIEAVPDPKRADPAALLPDGANGGANAPRVSPRGL